MKKSSMPPWAGEGCRQRQGQRHDPGQDWCAKIGYQQEKQHYLRQGHRQGQGGDPGKDGCVEQNHQQGQERDQGQGRRQGQGCDPGQDWCATSPIAGLVCKEH